MSKSPFDTDTRSQLDKFKDLADGWGRIDIYERDNFRCLYCDFDGATFEGWRYLTIDHIDPSGPRHDPHNLATCCRHCNSCKGNDPCSSIDEAKEIVARHDVANRDYWAKYVEPRLNSGRANPEASTDA